MCAWVIIRVSYANGIEEIYGRFQQFIRVR